MKKEIQIALLAIFTIAASIWGFKFISGTSMFSGDKLFYAVFNNVKDVNTATPVLINGYQVGTVVSIDPEPTDITNMKVAFQVKKEIMLPKHTVVELRSASPLGGKELELVFDQMCSGDNCAESGDILHGRTIGLIGSLINTRELEPHIDTITASITESIKSLGDPDSDAPLSRAIIDLARTFENLADATEKLDRLTYRSSANIERTFKNMAELSGAMLSSNEKLDSVLAHFEVITRDLSGTSLATTIEKSNNTLDQAAGSLVEMKSAMENANAAMTELHELVTAMNSEEGTLGNLINDPELYDNLRTTSYNMNLLLQDIRLNPRRYFRLFGKKSSDYTLPEEDPAMDTVDPAMDPENEN